MRDIIIKNSDRFKSVFVTVNLMLPLVGDETGKNALLALVLKSCNSLYKGEKNMARALASLYDATLDVDVEKIDNLYNIQFGMEILSGEYIGVNELDNAKKIIYSTICKPEIFNGRFDEKIFLREKESLIQKILEEKDDKKKYALEKLRQDMFKNTEYGCSTLGELDIVKNITNEELVKHYYKVRNIAKVVVVATGNLKNIEEFPENIYDLVTKEFGVHQIVSELDNKYNNDSTIIENIEEQQINQSVLCIGLRAIGVNKQDMYTLALYNAILGGTPASKLFQNVREKESLAYFAKSMYNKHKKVLYMFSGVEPNKVDRAKQVMLEQVELLKNGDISEVEFYAAKENLISAYKELQDSKKSVAKTILDNEVFFEKSIDIEEIIENIEKVTMQDVIKIAQNIKATNIFLLGGVQND